MKKLLLWTLAALALMIGCPWLAVTFAGTAGMAVCFLLFFGVNPLFAAICGWEGGEGYPHTLAPASDHRRCLFGRHLVVF